MSFANWPIRTVETERRRLEVLRYLAATPGYQSATTILRDHLRSVGIPTTDAQMAECSQWLADLGFVRHQAAEMAEVVRITSAGRDIARGFTSHPSIAQPDP